MAINYLTTNGIVTDLSKGSKLDPARVKVVKELILKEGFKKGTRLYKRTSYGLKEYFETKYNLYIANGEFIQAMFDLGFEYQTHLPSPNVTFKLDPKEPKRLEKEYFELKNGKRK